MAQAAPPSVVRRQGGSRSCCLRELGARSGSPPVGAGHRGGTDETSDLGGPHANGAAEAPVQYFLAADQIARGQPRNADVLVELFDG